MPKNDNNKPDVKIESDIPKPDDRRENQHWPFKEMKVGDSFEFPESERYLVTPPAWKFAKRAGIKFTVRKVSDGTLRIWRIT
jgi:hypothetical protein